MWTLDRAAPVPAWRPEGAPGAAIPGFSTRLGGVSAPPFHHLNLGRSTADDPAAVAENRRRFLAALGLDPSRLVTAGQVHGAEVAHVAVPGHIPARDILVTATPGLVLAVTTADCMPLLFVAPGAIGAAHSGWRGTADGAPSAALRAVAALGGADPADLQVHLGPCIRVCCYDVGPEVARRFPDAAIDRAGGRLRLDLPRAARLALEEAGLPAASFHDTGGCTACDPSLYYSYRRDHGTTGRHWGVIALRDPGTAPIPAQTGRGV